MKNGTEIHRRHVLGAYPWQRPQLLIKHMWKSAADSVYILFHPYFSDVHVCSEYHLLTKHRIDSICVCHDDSVAGVKIVVCSVSITRLVFECSGALSSHLQHVIDAAHGGNDDETMSDASYRLWHSRHALLTPT